jgi:hypothetical protein
MEILHKPGGEKNLDSEIVKLLIENNPGHDFGVNPKEMTEELMLRGLETDPQEVGYRLKAMGFRDRINVGKIYRKINLERLREVELEMKAKDPSAHKKLKPGLVYLYFHGFNPTNEKMKRFHERIPEPIRVKIGKWFCQTPIDAIRDYLKKCDGQGVISEEIKDLFLE